MGSLLTQVLGEVAVTLVLLAVGALFRRLFAAPPSRRTAAAAAA